jgi:OOP family OmpA-OmpF porin
MDSCISLQGPITNNGCPLADQATKDWINLAAKKILFHTGSFTLQASSFKSLDEIATVLSSNPTLSLLIEGHTDNIGSSARNQLLSENRAGAIQAYLISKGISRSRLKATGYGQSKPLHSNKSAEGRAQNRRVELVIQ